MAFERNSINALALGVNRDVDGTVDRVAEPPYEIWKMLAFLQRKCETENIEIISVFEVSVAWRRMYLLLSSACDARVTPHLTYSFNSRLRRSKAATRRASSSARSSTPR